MFEAKLWFSGEANNFDSVAVVLESNINDESPAKLSKVASSPSPLEMDKWSHQLSKWPSLIKKISYVSRKGSKDDLLNAMTSQVMNNYGVGVWNQRSHQTIFMMGHGCCCCLFWSLNNMRPYNIVQVYFRQVNLLTKQTYTGCILSLSRDFRPCSASSSFVTLVYEPCASLSLVSLLLFK